MTNRPFNCWCTLSVIAHIVTALYLCRSRWKQCNRAAGFLSPGRPRAMLWLCLRYHAAPCLPTLICNLFYPLWSDRDWPSEMINPWLFVSCLKQRGYSCMYSYKYVGRSPESPQIPTQNTWRTMVSLLRFCRQRVREALRRVFTQGTQSSLAPSSYTLG